MRNPSQPARALETFGSCKASAVVRV